MLLLLWLLLPSYCCCCFCCIFQCKCVIEHFVSLDPVLVFLLLFCLLHTLIVVVFFVVVTVFSIVDFCFEPNYTRVNCSISSLIEWLNSDGGLFLNVVLRFFRGIIDKFVINKLSNLLCTNHDRDYVRSVNKCNDSYFIET